MHTTNLSPISQKKPSLPIIVYPFFPHKSNHLLAYSRVNHTYPIRLALMKVLTVAKGRLCI